MVKENPERIITTRHWLVGPPVSLYSFFFHHIFFLLGPWEIFHPYTSLGLRPEGRAGRSTRTAEAVGAAVLGEWGQRVVISYQLSSSPHTRSLTHLPLRLRPGAPATIITTETLPCEAQKISRAPAPPQPHHTTPLHCVRLWLWVTRGAAASPPTAATRTSSAMASSCLLMPAQPACLPAQPITCIQTLLTFTHQYSTHNARFKDLFFSFLYRMW